MAVVAVAGVLLAAQSNLAGAAEAKKSPDAIQVVAWGSKSCRFCVRDKPELLRLQKSGKYVILFVDFDKHREFARKHKITKLPTYFVVKKNKVVFRTNSLKRLKAYTPPPEPKRKPDVVTQDKIRKPH